MKPKVYTLHPTIGSRMVAPGSTNRPALVVGASALASWSASCEFDGI